MAARISTGFHRMGIVLAVPVLLLALGLAWAEWRAPSGQFRPYHKSNDTTDSGTLKFIEDQWTADPVADLSKLSNEDLIALRQGALDKISNEGLLALGETRQAQAAGPPWPTARSTNSPRDSDWTFAALVDRL